VPAAGPARGTVSELSSEIVHSLYEDSRGRIWAAGVGTLLVAGAEVQHLLDSRHGLSDHSLYRVLEDEAGAFWVSSPRGVYELDRASVEAVLSGVERRLSIAVYGQEDGLRTIECHGLSQPAGARAADGSMWFPTGRGFIRIRPKAERTLPPPRVLIEGISTNLGRAELAANVNLRAGTRDIELQFTALRFSTPGKVGFRYRMTGFDPDWVAAGALRAARYNQLPPGPHVFEVQARDARGEWGAPAAIAIYQEPRFHQTWWFVLLLGLAAAAGVWAIYRWRLHAVRGRYAAVLEERNRIGREWHDTLVAGFSAISLQLEAARANVESKPGRASEILEVTRRMVHHYRAEARRVIWDLRDNRPEGETLPMALENALRRAVEHRGIQGRVSVEGEPAGLPVELQHNVLRICQEAISNSARHGNPARIDVDLVYRPNQLRAIVRDDGRGFGPDGDEMGPVGHFGLTVMRERARRHGGTLRIDSRPGEGTTVEATVPLTGVSR
jgi:signal transduction histidine kinase